MGRSRGSRDAVAHELFVVHYARLAGWVLRLVDDERTAHEVAAEAVTRLLARWGSVEDPRAYLYVTAATLLKDHWRKVERERAAPAGVPAPAAPAPADPDEQPPLRDVVDRLPERLRAVVLLRYYADLPVAEIARALGVGEGRAKRRLWEGRALLQEALAGATTRIDVDAYFAAEREAVEVLPAPSGQYARVRRAAGGRRLRGPAAAAVVAGVVATGVLLGTGHDSGARPDAARPRPLPVAPAGTLGPGAAPAHFKPMSVSFVSPRHGFALGTAPCPTRVVCSAVVETRDGGATWRAVAVPAQPSAGTPGNWVRFLDDRVGWIYGSGLWVTADGGATWRRQSAGPVRDLAVGGGRGYVLAGCGFGAEPACDQAMGPVVLASRRGDPASGWTQVAAQQAALPDPDQPGYRIVAAYPWLYVVAPRGGLSAVPVGPATAQVPNPTWRSDRAARRAWIVAADRAGPLVVDADRSVWRVGATGHLERVGRTPARPGYGNDTINALPSALAVGGRRIVAAYKLPGGPSSGSLDVSDDGGRHWIVRVGAPLGLVDVQLLGRFGVALTEAAAGTMYFSDDAGEHWHRYRFP